MAAGDSGALSTRVCMGTFGWGVRYGVTRRRGWQP
jgi:hypothetical protein